MLNITMCPSTECRLKETCYRNPASGTKPDEFKQTWFTNLAPDCDAVQCPFYWATHETYWKDNS